MPGPECGRGPKNKNGARRHEGTTSAAPTDGAAFTDVEMAEMAEKMSRDGFGAWEMCPQFVKMDENGENEVSHLTLGVMSLFSNKAGC